MERDRMGCRTMLVETLVAILLLVLTVIGLATLASTLPPAAGKPSSSPSSAGLEADVPPSFHSKTPAEVVRAVERALGDR